jgi:hypothetical protein
LVEVIQNILMLDRNLLNICVLGPIKKQFGNWKD